MHRSRLLLLLLCFCVGCQQATTSESLDDEVPSTIADEPITGERAVPNPGDERPIKDPFEPYGIGPPEQAIRRDQLRPEERALVDRSHNSDPATLEAYRRAVIARSALVTAQVGAHQLGVDNLAVIGVVP